VNEVTRRGFVHLGVGGGTIALFSRCAPSVPEAGVQTRRLGVLGDADSPPWDSFREGLLELGWSTGKNLAIEYRWAHGHYDAYLGKAAELVAMKVECLVAGAATASSAAKKSTRTIPIVAALVTSDAVGIGLVDDIARPAGNITGTTGVGNEELQPKLLQLLKELLPAETLIAILYNRRSAGADEGLRHIHNAASSLNVQLQLVGIDDQESLPGAFDMIRARGAQAALLLHTTFFASVRREIVDLSLRYRIPTATSDMELPRAGGLIAYGVNRDAIYRRAATYVDKVLKGVSPADLPMERPTKFDLAINLKTAELLGLTVPHSVFVQATQIIR
jgi:putative tryptophan/tyrosine transport system substrate-binding protein